MSAATTPFPDRHLRVRSTESQAMQRTMSSPSRQHQEALQFRLILAATYPFFLIAALVQRVLPGNAAQRPGMPVARRSIFGEAKAMAVSAIPFAFMG